MEIWKDIKGYEGLYQVSNEGRIFSVINSIFLKPIENNGYYTVSLYKNKKPSINNIHRLVAEAFIPNPNNLPCVNHKNEIKTDNKVNNLEWCTYQYNNTYNNKAKKIAIKESVQIKQYDLNGHFIKEWINAVEASKKLNILPTSINNCLKGRSKTSGGYIWKFK